MKRIFRPLRPGGLVDHWEWTSGHGLKVVFHDGLRSDSDYTLSELLKTERVVEITEQKR
jgi:hypothetical protein